MRLRWESRTCLRESLFLIVPSPRWKLTWKIIGLFHSSLGGDM